MFLDLCLPLRPSRVLLLECVTAMAIGARWSGQQCEATRLQRKKTASERRAQRLRAEGRRIQHALSVLDEVHSHRGGQRTKLGYLLREAFMQLKGFSTQRAGYNHDAVDPPGSQYSELHKDATVSSTVSAATGSSDLGVVVQEPIGSHDACAETTSSLLLVDDIHKTIEVCDVAESGDGTTENLHGPQEVLGGNVQPPCVGTAVSQVPS